MPRAKLTEAPEGMPHDGRPRAVIDAVLPCIDRGRFAAKCIAGQPFRVTVHAFTDGHDALRVMLLWQQEGHAVQEVEMTLKWNDEWHASFTPSVPGRYNYEAVAWVDHFRSWRTELARRVEAEDIRIAAHVGAELVEAAAARAKGEDREALLRFSAALKKPAPELHEVEALKALALDPLQAALVDRYPDRSLAVSSGTVLPLVADRERAGFSAWYELFPRSTSAEQGVHGRFSDVERQLPRIAGMGFDVVYFPPIHPIGREKRKGKNNALTTEPGDVGSPWAIGAAEGGHKSILPALGTADDFRRLVKRANELSLEIALDIALQCAPDHPYVKQHPQWFRWRPDGTVQYAENPPKKYQDIYPFNFETEDWQALWVELKSIFDHWIGEGVRIFRVDNPHTKSFAFWEWCIGEIRKAHPDVLFLAEAFTRPKVMHRLAKLGYSQSYTYFTWRNTAEELTDYFTELSQGPGRHYFRPNCWPNTPDILSEHLHGQGRPAFAMRLVLATTLSANYGVYGPAYELMENTPRSAGSEEYLHSEKYQLRHWDLNRADSLAPLMTRLNTIRRENRALQSNAGLEFFTTDNEQLLAYAKRTHDGENLILCVVNLDVRYPQSGWVELDTTWLGLAQPGDAYELDDLLHQQSFIWRGPRNFVILQPGQAHVMRLRRGVRNERDSESFQR
jgi:starch synthase (maltosyl-transferring)